MTAGRPVAGSTPSAGESPRTVGITPPHAVTTGGPDGTAEGALGAAAAAAAQSGAALWLSIRIGASGSPPSAA